MKRALPAILLAGCASAPLRNSKPEAYCKPLSGVGTPGRVELAFMVDADGSAGQFVVLNSVSAPPELVQQVEGWVSGCRFQPATDDSGKPVAARVVQNFQFR